MLGIFTNGQVLDQVAVAVEMLETFSKEQIIDQITGRDSKLRVWLPDTIEYSIPDQAPPSGARHDANGFVQMQTGQLELAREAFELWDDLIAINLKEITDRDATITMALSTTTSGTEDIPSGVRTYTDVSTQPFGGVREITSSRIWLNANKSYFNEAQIDYGNKGFNAMVHEVGHALGLYHPGDYNATDPDKVTYEKDAEYAQDTRQYTIMSYFAAGKDGSGANHGGYFPATPLLHDIMAIQAIYGADMTTRVGDTTYGFHSNAGRSAFSFERNPNPIIAIWDAGGVDTLDASGFATNQRIDLRSGEFSDVGALTKNVAIAYGATIENAVGGSGKDTITGNDANNLLVGNAGDDSLSGGMGMDTLNGGHGSDTMAGGAGNDIYYVDTATTLQSPTLALITLPGGTKLPVVLGDRIIDGLNQGNDTVRASINYTLDNNLERLELIGQANLDGTGNGFVNTLVGNAGNNTLTGLAGNDSLLGNAGNDILVGGSGRDTMEGHGGSDIFDFNLASDSPVGATLRDQIVRFSHADGDKIDLRSIDALAGGSDNAFVFIGSKSFATYDAEHPGLAGMVRASGGVVQIDIGGDRTVDMEIQVSGLTLSASDFIL